MYAKKRSGEVIAFLCTLFLLLTSLFLKYAVEARSYSLLIACIAFALICYQRVPSTWWTILLGISLAVAQTLHHYAVFAMVPFGLAEAVYFVRAHKFRWQVWLALLAGVMPLLFFWPLLVQRQNVFSALTCSTVIAFPRYRGRMGNSFLRIRRLRRRLWRCALRG